MYVVTGSTGQVGNALVRELVRRGRKVRALYRDEKKAAALEALGAEPVLASIEDASALECAFRQAEGVFVMTPPFYKSHDPRGENAMALASLAHALRAAHAGRCVCLSSIGAEHAQGTGAILKLHDMEEVLFKLTVPVAAIRAGYFMENLRPVMALARESGRLPVMTDAPEMKIPMVATRDIAALAADLFESSWTSNQVVELEGPERYSMQDAAHIFSGLTGREVVATPVPHAERQAFYQHAGFTEASAATMVEMSEGAEKGLTTFTGSEAARRRGATSLAEAVKGW